MDTPNYIRALLIPTNGSKPRARRVWGIDLETIWLPFFTATNVMGDTAIPADAMGAPLRLGYNADGSVKFSKTGRPFVIENLKRAPLINPLMLCGTMFGLRVKRHRYFECKGFDVWFAPATCACKGKAGYTASHDGQSSFRRGAKLITVAGHNFLVDEARQAMGLNWMTQRELAEAIPWVYTSYIGKFLLEALLNTLK